MKTKRIVLLVALLVIIAALSSCSFIEQLSPCMITGHNWTDATCTAPKTCADCGATEGEALGHTEEIIPGMAATCTTGGYTEGKICTVCNEVTVAQEEISALGHTEEVVPGYAATCTEKGLKDGKKCSVCDEILLAQEEIAALGHTEEVVLGYAATCTETGLKDGKKCSVCGETLVAQEEIAALGHTEEVVPGKAATCTETGLKDGKKCSVCGETLVAQEEIPALGHTEEIVPGKDATCVENGITDGKRCSVCGETLLAQESINALGHKDEDGDFKCDICEAELCTDHIEGEAKEENRVEATCTAEGSYDLVVKCSVCGDELSREHKVISKLPHTEEVVPGYAATCTETGLKDGKKCSVCGETLVAQEEIPALGHTEEVVPGKAATCTETGLKDGKKCSVCGETLVAQEEIPTLGHAYGEASYVWSDDNSVCTATKICANDPSHVVTENATVISVKVQASAEKVIYTYNVEFADSDFAAQSKIVEGAISIENKIATVNAPAIAGRVASHDYVKFSFHNAEAIHEFTIYYSEIDVWDGTSVSERLSGSGTLEDPYLIQSGADLAYLKSVVDAAESYTENIFAGVYFKMTKSIDLGGRHFMIGYHTAWNKYDGFAGIFDGNNCTIRGLNIKPESGTAALFACVKKGGEVKNLSLYGQVSGTANVASAVGYLLGTIDNITNYAAINGTSTLGGVVANAENKSSIVNGCVNYADITGTSYIVGGITGSGGHIITNCSNWGNVVAGSESVGGITGTTKDTGYISGCANYGDVTVTVANVGMIGGIAGKAVKPISDCVNYGTITGVNTTGGIAGSSTKDITNCHNYGTVNGTSWLIGGIVGATDANISDCTNYGTITSTGDCVGGIAGSSKATISGCTNYGTVKGIGRSAGIAYYSNGTIENCINNGDVIGGWDLGGILAWVGDGQSATIKNCTNNGNVTGTWNNGGIFGLAHDNAGTVTITGCTNNGKINSYTGGQITIAVKAVITDCTESGSYVVLHELAHVEAKAPTCTEAGNVEHDHCSVCGKNYDAEGNELESVEVKALGHTEEVVPGYAATCTEDGLTDGKKCSVCGEILVAQEVIPAGHKDEDGDLKCDACGTTLCDHVTETVKENEKAPTCTDAGSYDSVVKCTVCGTEISRETVTVDSLGHAYEIAYVWADDNSSCTVNAVCANDASHVINETATVSSILLNVSATKVTYTYNAVFASEDLEAQTKVIEADVTLANNIATINAPAIAGRVASHDYVKFGFHDAAATYEFTIYYSEIDVWDGSVATEFAGGSGTENDPYIIKTGAQLAYLAKLGMDGTSAKDSVYGTGIYYKLGASLDLSGHQWTPIAMYDKGYSWTYFDGNFDGANHKIIFNISTTSYGYGLFAGLGKTSVVKNLTLYGSVQTAHRAGALTYITQDGAHIENVVNYATVNCTASGGYVGGLVGSLSGANTVMTNCVNYGAITSAGKQTGGLTGTTPSVNVSNCVNFGNVSCSVGTVGGISGTTTTAVLTGCYNYGTISGLGTIGGIVGNVTTSTKINNSVNYGTIDSTSYNSGGIGGYMGEGSSIDGCTNYGAVSATKSNTGGIIGQNKGAVSNCENYGNITGVEGYTNGIAGASSGTVENCTDHTAE